MSYKHIKLTTESFKRMHLTTRFYGIRTLSSVCILVVHSAEAQSCSIIATVMNDILCKTVLVLFLTPPSPPPGSSILTCSSLTEREAGTWRSWTLLLDWPYKRRSSGWKDSLLASLRCSSDWRNYVLSWGSPLSSYLSDMRDSDMTAATLLLVELFIIIIIIFSTPMLQRTFTIIAELCNEEWMLNADIKHWLNTLGNILLHDNSGDLKTGGGAYTEVVGNVMCLCILLGL